MAISREIYESLRELSDSAKGEVLDFIEFLKTKQDEETESAEDVDWRNLSLESAMRGIKKDEEPTYTSDDIVEVI